MIALPIVRRELLVAGRQRWTYWTRCLAALLLLVLGTTLSMFYRSGMAKDLPQVAFLLLSCTAFAVALIAGVWLNAASLATERQEGTLGLLFLTELDGTNVALGKLVASSIQGICALLAMLPILAIPLMMGGVAWADFGCTALVLVSTLLASAGIGLWASSRSSTAIQAYSTAILALLGLSVLPITLAWVARRLNILPPNLYVFELLSPVAGFIRAKSAGIASSSAAHAAQLSAAMVGVVGLASLLRAAMILRRTGRAGLAPPNATGRSDVGAPPRGVRHRPVLGRWTGSPYGWFYGWRMRPIAALNVAFYLGLAAFVPFAIRAMMTSGNTAKVSFITSMFIAYGLHVLFKVRVALVGVGPWFEEATGGGLELLLTTPLTPEAIRGGHRDAIHRSVSASRWVLTTVNLLLVFVSVTPGVDASGSGIRTAFFSMFFGGIVSLWTDVYCLRNHGMWLGMRVRKLGQAIGWALLLVLLPPWIGALVIFLLASQGLSESRIGPYFVMLELFQIGVALMLGRSADRRLHAGFRSLAVGKS